MTTNNKRPEEKRDKKSLTLKQREWLAKTIVTKNPTEAAQMAYDVKDRHNASVIASENLSKPYLREALSEMLEVHGLALDDTIKEHKWLIGQRANIPTKFDAIKEHYELLGLHSKDNKINSDIRIALVIRK